MKIACNHCFSTSKVTLNEYGYHLVKKLCQKKWVSEVVILSDKTQGKGTWFWK
jgi:hypothetical protein